MPTHFRRERKQRVTEDGEPVYIIDDLAGLFQVSRKTIYLWERTGILPPREHFEKKKVGWRKSRILPYLKTYGEPQR